MTESLFTILIIEDDEDWQARYAHALAGKVTILAATTVKDGRAQFQNNPEIRLIVMDACVPGSTPTTPRLVQEIRRTFTGPMIAASGDEMFRELLVHVGCDHQAKKADVPEKVLALLGLTNPSA